MRDSAQCILGLADFDMIVANFTPGFVSGDGIGNAARARVRALLRNGHEVIVIAHQADPWPESEPGLICHITGSTWLDGTVDLPISIQSRLQLADVAVVDFGFYSPLHACAGRLVCPMLLTYHGLTPPDLISDSIYSAGYFRAVGELLQLSPTLVISDSSIMHREFVDIGGDSTIPHRVIHLFGQTSRQLGTVAVRNSESIDLLCVGRIYPNKNLEVAIEATRILKSRGLEVTLRIIGGGGDTIAQRYLQKLKALAAPLGDCVQFLGRVPQRRLDELYERCSAVVIPSLHEGFSLPAVEALVHGKPVYASRLGALPETLGDAGVFFDPFDPGSLADVVALHSGDSEAELISARERAFRRANELTEERFGKESLQAIADVCDGVNRARAQRTLQVRDDSSKANTLVLSDLQIHDSLIVGCLDLRDEPSIDLLNVSLRAAFVGKGLLLCRTSPISMEWNRVGELCEIRFRIPRDPAMLCSELILSLHDNVRDVPCGEIRACQINLLDDLRAKRSKQVQGEFERLRVLLREAYAPRWIAVSDASGFIHRVKARFANALLSLMHHVLIAPQTAFLELLLQSVKPRPLLTPEQDALSSDHPVQELDHFVRDRDK
jgi:glycosyltransferase involved in cell wall biosynthesis